MRRRWRRAKWRQDTGQLKLMIFAETYQIRISCWICSNEFDDRALWTDHVIAVHHSHCVRCGRKHSGECKPKRLVSYRFEIKDGGVFWESDEDLKRRHAYEEWIPHMETARIGLS